MGDNLACSIIEIDGLVRHSYDRGAFPVSVKIGAAESRTKPGAGLRRGSGQTLEDFSITAVDDKDFTRMGQPVYVLIWRAHDDVGLSVAGDVVRSKDRSAKAGKGLSDGRLQLAQQASGASVKDLSLNPACHRD
jgi:hypothetical protein